VKAEKFVKKIKKKHEEVIVALTEVK